MKVKVADLGSLSLIVLMVSWMKSSIELELFMCTFLMVSQCMVFDSL